MAKRPTELTERSTQGLGAQLAEHGELRLELNVQPTDHEGPSR